MRLDVQIVLCVCAGSAAMSLFIMSIAAIGIMRSLSVLQYQGKALLYIKRKEGQDV